MNVSEPMNPRHLGVIGAGVIGVGVVQDLAQTGHDVTVVDTDDNALRNAEKVIRRNVRLHHLMAALAKPLNVDEVMMHIQFATDAAELSDCQFVIENITEDWQAKKDLYENIDRICNSSCIFAVNTSVIPITRIASLTSRPDKVVGMHFMNPVSLKPVVEVIRGYHTSDETLEVATRLLSQMSKSAIVVNDSPGFVSNRVLMLTVNEAAFLVHEGVAESKDVDAIFRDCFGHAMGPLETADLIGIDTVLRSIEMLWSEFRDSKYRPCPLLGKMEAAGLLGRKSGRGFYSYAANSASKSNKGGNDGRH